MFTWDLNYLFTVKTGTNFKRTGSQESIFAQLRPFFVRFFFAKFHFSKTDSNIQTWCNCSSSKWKPIWKGQVTQKFIFAQLLWTFLFDWDFSVLRPISQKSSKLRVLVHHQGGQVNLIVILRSYAPFSFLTVFALRQFLGNLQRCSLQAWSTCYTSDWDPISKGQVSQKFTFAQ